MPYEGPWRPEERKKLADEELKRMKRYKDWGDQKRKEAERIVKERDDELRKVNEFARGKKFTDEEWEEAKKEAYNKHIRGVK